ncbi:D-alanine--D-alanine ligase [Blattabacterium sp. DPU]|uniref:D-alanine--D-alanine ligase n=1 Tax=Blattabacterium sp. DPU TaxID=2715232 RepID=UPI00140864C5|nr:D-alanine--D-alanine ligase [Blattabacterium sp. DPU]QIK16530.1 D-alanine--D-alanine ligase [Blattabacterium sp. DPU]
MKKIAVIMGGYSKESLISIQSGKVVYENLCRKEFDPYRIYLLKEKWFLKNDENKEYSINKQDFTIFGGMKGLKFDCIFNAIHGTPGEDGILQAYFELLKIPYTGCNFHHANVTFNKKYCLTLLKHFGINTAESFFLNKNQVFCTKKIIDKVGLPCFVKPNRSGSSLGISKVYKEKDLDHAIQKAFLEDEEIIVESYLEGREVSVGVFSFKNEVIVLPITEIISQNDFFDFESKYSGKSKEITPAKFDPNIENKIRKIAMKVYKFLNLSGISRSEYIIVNEEPFFLEINTIPGFSEESIFPKQLKAIGMSLSEVFKDSIFTSIDKMKK